jgi:hypothetical protein
MQRIIAAAILVLGCSPALAADNTFPTPGNAQASGSVLMCLDGSGKAIPATAAGTCLGTGGGGGGGGAVTNAGTFAVQNTAATPAGTNLVGKVGIDQTTPGTTNGVQVNAALPAGANLIGKTGIDQTTPGTTNGVQVNAALPSGTNLIGKTGIDQTTPGTTNGVQVNAALPAGTNVIGTVNQSSQYPAGATAITASATGTTAATTATLAGTSGKTTYICGYSIRANATANTNVTNTITGVITATLSSIMWVPANTAGLGVDEQIFSPCIPASATNTGIAIVSGAPGTGGLVSAKGWGYQL